MYDNNNNQHQAYYPTGGYSQNSQPTPQPVERPRKKQSTLKVIALVMAVAIIGGGAGFGGSYLAARSMTNTPADSSKPYSDTVTNPDNGNNDNKYDVPEDERPSLDEMQSGVTITHNVSKDTEFNSDGTFTYTRDLVSAVRDSIVYIEVYTKQYYDAREPYGAGSGIIISSDGYVLTNAHVVDGMDRFVVHVTTTDPVEGTGVVDEFEAVVVGSDTDTDLAIVKIEAEGLQAAVLGDSDDLRLGDDVVAIGNPMGLETSISKGIVSGLNREQYTSERGLSSIQTDAAINSGNSGGALFNMYGEVVGVVNSKLVMDYAEGIGFAITINEARDVIDDLIAQGFVSGRPILGITCLEVSEYVAAIQGMTPGLYVTAIDQSLAIADSDLVVGDTIVAVEGVYVTSVSEVSEVLADRTPGETVTVTVVRVDSIGRSKEVKIDVVLSEYTGR